MGSLPRDTKYPVNTDSEGFITVKNLVWNTSTLSWQVATGGAGGTDVSVTNFPTVYPMTTSQLPASLVGGRLDVNVGSGSITISAVGQGDSNTIANAWPVKITDGVDVLGVTGSGAILVDGSATTQPISGSVSVSNFPASQGVNVNQLNGNTVDLGSGSISTGTQRVVLATDQPTIPVNDGGGSLTVDGTVTANAGTGTFAISAASLPLPTGAATAAKQPALGTAGSASADVITVQGIASMTALKVDGSAVTQPVSGTVSISGSVAATQSGTWTVQPGNTTNTTPWLFTVSQGGNSATVTASNALKVDGSAVTQPVSGTVTITHGKTLKSASFSTSSTGTVVSAVVSKRIKVYSVKLVVSAAISVNWRDGGSTALEGAQPLPANGGYTESVSPPAFLFGTSAGNSLDLVISGTGTASGRVSYWDDDAS